MPPGKSARRTSSRGALFQRRVSAEPGLVGAVGVANSFAVTAMVSDKGKRALKTNMTFAAMLVAAGTAITVLSLGQIMATSHQQLAQATPPTQSTPGADTKPSASPSPAPETTGQRPSDVPPQPARPDPDAQKAGAQPALP